VEAKSPLGIETCKIIKKKRKFYENKSEISEEEDGLEKEGEGTWDERGKIRLLRSLKERKGTKLNK